MIDQFDKLTTTEQALLLKAPVLVSVLASCSNKEVNKHQKADAVKLAHLKTFTANPLLISYYTEVERKFEEQFEDAIREYFPFGEVQRTALKKEIDKVNQLMGKLDGMYARLLHKSLEKYANHVKKAAHSVFVDFIFPVPIHDLTD